MRAARECREEIGAAVEVTGLIGVYHIAKTDGSEHGRDRLSGAARGGRRRLQAGAEMLEVGVFSLDSLPPLAFPSHRQMLDDYLSVPGVGGGSGISERRRRAPRATRPSRDASAIATTAHAVKPAA